MTVSSKYYYYYQSKANILLSELKKYAMEAIMEVELGTGMTTAEKQSETEEALPDFLEG